MIADGNLTLTVEEIDKANYQVVCRIENDYELGERKNVNIPGAKIEMDTITEKDVNDIVNFGVKNKVDFIALSFAQDSKTIIQCKELLGDHFAKVIPKIENESGLQNLREIL